MFPAQNITDVELQGVHLTRDLQSTLVTGDTASTAKTQIIWQASFDQDPFAALYVDGHTCRGLELVRAEYVQRAGLRRTTRWLRAAFQLLRA